MTRDEMLINEARRKMKMLYEYSYFNKGVYEDGEQANDPNGGAPGMDPMAGGDPNAMGGDPNAMGGAPDGGAPGMDPMAGGDPNAIGGAPDGGVDGANLAPNAGQEGGDPNAMGGDPMGAPGMDPMAGGDPNAMGGDPMGAPGMDPMGGGEPGSDDDVVDITALTDAQSQMQQSQDEMMQAQEEIAGQMGDVDQKLATLMQVVDKFTQALTANDEKINDLKRELVKRTPTEEETMNVRLNAGGNPFDQKPEEFWDKFKDINNHYNITANNDAPQYQIRKADIDNFNDKMVSDGIDDFDEIPGSLKEYFVR